MDIAFEQSITLEAKAPLSVEAAGIEFVSVHLTNPPRSARINLHSISDLHAGSWQKG